MRLENKGECYVLYCRLKNPRLCGSRVTKNESEREKERDIEFVKLNVENIRSNIYLRIFKMKWVNEILLDYV
jgi:hypothetical protein